MINKERVVVPGMRICAAEDHYTSGNFLNPKVKKFVCVTFHTCTR